MIDIHQGGGDVLSGDLADAPALLRNFLDCTDSYWSSLNNPARANADCDCILHMVFSYIPGLLMVVAYSSVETTMSIDRRVTNEPVAARGIGPDSTGRRPDLTRRTTA